MDLGLGKSGAAAAPAGDIIKDVTTATFAKDVLEASRTAPVIVDFWAPWCGPCKQLTPILEKVVRSYGGKVKLVKINIDENAAIAGQLRVQSIPTVYAFRDGRPLDGFMGAQPESAVKAFVDRCSATRAPMTWQPRWRLPRRRSRPTICRVPRRSTRPSCRRMRRTSPRSAGLARCYLKSGDTARAEQTIGLVPPDKRDAAAWPASVPRSSWRVRPPRRVTSASSRPRCRPRPADHQARLDLALALAATGKKSEALDHLLEIFRRDRKWNEEAARKQLVQLFDAWGPKDPATLEGRRRLSSLMFS
jgi:putative thioredoxin